MINIFVNILVITGWFGVLLILALSIALLVLAIQRNYKKK